MGILHPTSSHGDRVNSLCGKDVQDQDDSIRECSDREKSKQWDSSDIENGQTSKLPGDDGVKFQDPGEHPDGGFWAWASAIAGHFVMMNSWGYNSSFGVFQTYYTAHLDNPASQIAWIGSVQVSVLFFVGAFAGRLTDAGHFHITFAVGTFFTCLGVFMTSLSTVYWQILLSQGICTGLLFTPALAMVSTYFKRRRALAFGITATGSAIGFGWTVRAMGFVQLVTLCLANFLLRPKVPPKRSGSVVDLAAFREKPYACFAIGVFLTFWGLYFAYYYLASFAVSQLDPPFSYTDSLNLLLVVNGVGMIGRSVSNAIAHRFGCITVLIPVTLTAGICMLAWPAVSTAGGLYGWASIYGIAAGAIQSLFPPALTDLTTDVQKTGARMGIVFTIDSIATLTGPPIAGTIIRKSGGHYLGAQVFAGVSLLLGGSLVLVARYLKCVHR
ncbi:hypothetical protein BHE90_003857 [Fusarium euwallaceae]|uniref:Major facilitator superfamily (MFS) profile domain-containing protein n=1 Tax=Fusarium euwallaceae TaxID=1147111 RepID=A0A430M0S7_9HYPO|nr:hypothetical protein BHE90_003857 [Fusarium euwallaceae]